MLCISIVKIYRFKNNLFGTKFSSNTWNRKKFFGIE